MRFPLFRVRTLMIAVAAVAVVVAAVVVVDARRQRFASIAAQHNGTFPSASLAEMMTPDDRRRSRLSKPVVAWHAEMVREYRHAARYPWLPVPPDPPRPE